MTELISLTAHALALAYYFQLSVAEAAMKPFAWKTMLAVFAYGLLTVHSALILSTALTQLSA